MVGFPPTPFSTYLTCGRTWLRVSSPALLGSATFLYFTLLLVGHSPFALGESTGLLGASGSQSVVVTSAKAVVAPNASSSAAHMAPTNPVGLTNTRNSGFLLSLG